MGLVGRKVQANYPILGCFSSNYTLVVHLHCYSLAVVLIAHWSGLVFFPVLFLRRILAQEDSAGTRRGTGGAVGAASLTSVWKCGNHFAASSA